MKIPETVILYDSLGDIKPDNVSPILVCASHCGDNGAFAQKLQNCNVKAVFLNNAGIGKNEAGISGLLHYAAAGILACAVDNNSAEIGVALDTWESGVISNVNKLAQAMGVQVGVSVKDAVALIDAAMQTGSFARNELNIAANVAEQPIDKVSPPKQFQTQITGKSITVTNSITFLNESNAGNIVVCGSHGGVSAGHYAQKHCLKAVFFNDAGIGKNNAGIKSLDSLSEAGILACTVDCRSAEIFNGQDALENGIVSVCNSLAKAKGIAELMTVKDAIGLI